MKGVVLILTETLGGTSSSLGRNGYPVHAQHNLKEKENRNPVPGQHIGPPLVIGKFRDDSQPTLKKRKPDKQVQDYRELTN